MAKLPKAEAYYLVIGPGCWGCYTDPQTAIKNAVAEWGDSKPNLNHFNIVAVTEDWQYYDDGYLTASETQRLGTVADWKSLSK